MSARIFWLGALVGVATGCGGLDPGEVGPLRTCGQTHPLVGWTVRLSERFHGTQGIATVTDDCTLTLSEFSYDGGGVDVRIRGVVAPNWGGGFKLGPQLLGRPRVNETLSVNLPVGRTLDELDGVSIWCEAARVSFGDGRFAPP